MIRYTRVLFLTSIIMFLMLTGSLSTCLDEPAPPDQPSNGPGSSDYLHYGVRKTRYKWGARQYWIFEPYSPKPESAPLIVFNHGWGAKRPISYRAWIDHLVKRGNLIANPLPSLTISKAAVWSGLNVISSPRTSITKEGSNQTSALIILSTLACFWSIRCFSSKMGIFSRFSSVNPEPTLQTVLKTSVIAR